LAALAGRRIVLGVSGGIAAYKSVEVLRRLRDEGAHVIPVMTQAAHHFIGATTLSALASEPVRTSMWDGGPDPIPHTRLGQQADLVVVAPATARVIGAYANGLSTDLLTNTLIATHAPVVLAPARRPTTGPTIVTPLRRSVATLSATDACSHISVCIAGASTTGAWVAMSVLVSRSVLSPLA